MIKYINMNKEQIIQRAGLNKKETKVYLASLALGVSSITQLAKKSGLKRPNTYLVIDDLLKKQLLIKIPKDKKIYYKAENPETFKQKLAKQQDDFSQILPELTKIYSTNLKQPKVRFYEGKKGIRQVQEEMCRAKEIWAIFSPENFLKVFSPQENQHFFRILIRRGGILYDMFEDTKKAREFARVNYRTGVSQVKFLPKNFHFATDIWVHDDKMVMVSFENLSCVVVEDESIARTQKLILQFLWNQLPSSQDNSI